VANDPSYLVGRGIADITGEAAGCGMLGYGKADQTSAGIHLRLRARAFVIAEAAAPESPLLLIVAELPLVFNGVRREVLRRLGERFGARYGERNTMITGTHTHCGPGGYAHHRLYNMTTHGYRPKTFGAIVAGLVEAVERAHADIAQAELALAFGELENASVNRSPTAFARNPEADRAHFPNGIDPQTTLLTISRGGLLVGAVNWFATHGTSMSNRNLLISSDNKGYAAYAWERLEHGVDYRGDEQPEFIGAFAQTNTGDMSPNLNRRPASGPTEDEFDNTRIIGERQQRAAAALVGAGAAVTGPLDARLTYIDLSDFAVDAAFCPDGRAHRTSGPYAGAAQIAGTDEGKGFAGFNQGRNPVFDLASAQVTYRLAPGLRDSQAPKGLVLPRAANRVASLMQERIPVQLWRLGPLYLIGLPAEVTIVAGLRLRRAVAQALDAPLNNVLIAGYSNGYIHYVTTPEEYLEQRYEGGSTMFGRWELPALVQTATALATAMRDGAPVELGTPAPDAVPHARASVTRDLALAEDFGTVLRSPRARYAGGDTVEVELVGAYPNNGDLLRGASFFEVQCETDGGWTRVADDSDWATRFGWRKSGRTGSRITLRWDIPADTTPGRYRLVYFALPPADAGVELRLVPTATFEICS
jgi:neutral ceramidase